MVAGIVTAVLLVLFVAGWVWAWSPRRKADFDAAARLPLDPPQANAAKPDEPDAGKPDHGLDADTASHPDNHEEHRP